MAREYANFAPCFAVWLQSEARLLRDYGWSDSPPQARIFESWVEGRQTCPAELDRLRTEYRDICWSNIIAAERSFTDYSQLLGAAGHRLESRVYIERLVTNIATFFEDIIRRGDFDAAVCQTADTLFSLAFFRMAAHYGVKVYAISPAWLLEPGKEGGFFCNNEFLESEAMIEAYHRLKDCVLLPTEIDRITRLIDGIRGFSGKTNFYTKNKGVNAGFKALSPNLGNIVKYLHHNAGRNSDVEYIKIDPWRKAKANIMRAWRKWQTRDLLGSADPSVIPEKSVFFAFHYQPEQSTLAQGLYFANQVAMIEDISKSLPLGYTLVVKEHPWGRGNRPAWQYRHLGQLYNVMFCDAPAKEIIPKVEALVTITSTVAMEALVFDKPTILLGRSFFSHCDLFYRSNNVSDLPELLARILIDRDYDAIPYRDEIRNRFLLSYLETLVPHFPVLENSEEYGLALTKLIKQLQKRN